MLLTVHHSSPVQTETKPPTIRVAFRLSARPAISVYISSIQSHPKYTVGYKGVIWSVHACACLASHMAWLTCSFLPVSALNAYILGGIVELVYNLCLCASWDEGRGELVSRIVVYISRGGGSGLGELPAGARSPQICTGVVGIVRYISGETI